MKLLLTLLLLPGCLGAAAQATVNYEARAEQLFGYMLRNQADSLYQALTDKAKVLIQPEQLKDGMAQAERMAGKYVEHTAWQREKNDEVTVLTSTVTFEQAQLNCLVALDAEGRMAGIRLLPPMPLQPAHEQQLPQDAIEVDDTVRTSATVALPATLTLSGRSQQPPMVVMVHGSGALDRDETVMANQTFRDLARQLAERGISSLRYDKRTFVYRQPVATMDDETVVDALAALSLAHTYSNKVFLLGHSLGAMMAPQIAQRAQGQVAGIVMMAATARDLQTVIAEQVAWLVPADSASAALSQTLGQLRQTSPHYLQPQHQVETAQALTLPMLIMQGGRDYQVTTADYSLWQQALQGHKNVTMKLYDNLNHLFLEGTGKSTPQEYMVRKNIPAEVADDLARFISSH